MIFKIKTVQQEKQQYLFWGIIDNSVPGYTLIVPTQDRFLMLYIRSGKGRISQGENCWLVEHGDLLFLRFGLTFLIESVNGPLTFTTFIVSGTCEDAPFISTIKSDSTMEYLLEELYRICSMSVSGIPIPQLDTFLSSVKSSSYQKPLAQHHGHSHAEIMKQLLDNRFTEALHLEQLAKELHLNKYKLAKDFKASYGVPPIEYLINRRIQEACRLLRESDKSVSAIGDEIGIENAPYFIRVFKKKVGCTPNTYRKSQKCLPQIKHKRESS